MEIKPNAVYTTKEVEELLKISSSTIKRLLKKGLLKANKIGGQYRILGHELFRALSPEMDVKATSVYHKVKKRAINIIDKW
jgi:excisionase family DNA binding protein